METKHHYIYKTTQISTGEFYIGRHSTTNLDDGYIGSGVWISEKKEISPESDFKREILRFCEEAELAGIETETILLYWNIDPLCMNKTPASEGFLPGVLHPFYGKKFSDEHRANMSKSMSGVKKPEGFADTIRAIRSGMTFNEEWCKNIGRAQVGSKHSEETKKKMSEAQRGEKNAMYGKKMSDEAKKKIGLANKGKIRDAEFGRKVSKGLTGVKHMIVKCPHCGKEGGDRNMKRWHFDKCRQRNG